MRGRSSTEEGVGVGGTGCSCGTEKRVVARAKRTRPSQGIVQFLSYLKYLLQTVFPNAKLFCIFIPWDFSFVRPEHTLKSLKGVYLICVCVWSNDLCIVGPCSAYL